MIQEERRKEWFSNTKSTIHEFFSIQFNSIPFIQIINSYKTYYSNRWMDLEFQS